MLENKSNRTELSELGEFGLIRHLSEQITLKNKSSLKGIGDDAAVIKYDNKFATVVTTDLLIEGIHFDLIYVPLKHLGYKAVMVNLSDIYAMNAKPQQILVSIGISNRFSLEAVEEIYDGMRMACERHGVDIVGGDTSTSKMGLILSITALGCVDPTEIVGRDGAGVHDLICVSGDLGSAYAGLQILERERKIFLENPSVQPDVSGKDYLLERQLKPEARKDIIELFKTLGIKPTSMIDVSDGLSSELLHICTQSNVGCRIYEEKIPLDMMTEAVAQEFGMNPLIYALNGGEDYELLFTLKIEEYPKVKDNADIIIIGHITDKKDGCKLELNGGQLSDISAQGWDSFKNS